ncbi:uncharacterized protein [Argopecten irradians]|uniref:uncharacterized protein n=1 Tax=Argopecten irradians TaxID=31199 RepID=UPI00371C86D9
MLLGITMSVFILGVHASKIRQYSWKVSQTASLLCDLPTNSDTTTITVKSLIQCLAFTQLLVTESGFAAYNTTSGLCTPDPATLPSAFGQMYESGLEPVTMGDPIPGHCLIPSWTLTFKTRSDGSVAFGDKTTLFNNLNKGDDVKIKLGDEDIYLEAPYVIHNDNDYCAVTPFVILKSQLDTLHLDGLMMLTKVCTDGQAYIGKQILGTGNSLIGENQLMELTWFTRKLPEDPGLVNPVYYHRPDGTRLQGSLRNLLTSLQRGKSIRTSLGIVKAFSSHERLERDNCNVVGQTVFRLGLEPSSLDIVIPGYWRSVLYSTTGPAEMTRWNIGEHVYQYDSPIYLDLKWFVDVCWGLALIHSDSGKALSGSFESLKAHILNGRRIRIQFYQFIMEADNIVISDNGHIITAQFLSQMDTTEPMVFAAGHWKWIRLSTDGSIRTDIYEMGSSIFIRNSVASTAASWFVQRRQWVTALVTSSTGSVINGSKTDLANAIRNGSSLRCVVHFDNNDILAFTADHIEVKDGEVAAQLIRYIQFEDGSIPGFMPSWKLTVVCTNGKFKQSRWVVGEHTTYGEKQFNVNTTWLVDH